MGIALKESKEMGINLPGLQLAFDFYQKAKEMNLENKGTLALYKVFEELN